MNLLLLAAEAAHEPSPWATYGIIFIIATGFAFGNSGDPHYPEAGRGVGRKRFP